MNGLINLFVRRPVTVIMLLAALLIAAVFSLAKLPVNRLPDISLPRVTVETVYSGMAANEIRSLVTIPLEDGLSPIKGLERIRSVSRDNRSIISLDFRWGTDPMAASVLVREAVDAVYPGLPEGVKKPTVAQGNSGSEPHAVIAVFSHNGNAQFERKLAEYELRARFRKIDGVGSVILVGGEVTEERLLLDVPRLAALGIDPSEFAGFLAQETADVPAGNARDGNMELVVVSSGKPDSVSSLSKIILPAGDGTLKVQDAGRLVSASARRESVFVNSGKESAALEIYRRPGADPLRLSREIRKTVDEANYFFSRDAQIEIISDSTPALISGIKGLLFSAALGALAVVTVLFLFIRRLKYSLLASLSIPVSAAAGICVLFVTGKTLNSMSLGGLAMGIGLVSDISVIVLDILHRSFGKKEVTPTPEETGNRAFSISGSSIASTITTALVFVPVIFLPGSLGSLFGDIAVALVTSVAAGWLYAQFFLPSLYRLFFNFRISGNKNNLTNIKIVFKDGSFEKKYRSILLSSLHRPGRIYAVSLLVTLIGILTLLVRPVVFISPDKAEEVHVSVVSPPGTLLENAGFTGAEISRLVSELPSVKTVYGKAGAEEEDIGRRADIDYRKEELILRCILSKGAKPENALAEISCLLEQFRQKPEFLQTEVSVYFPKDRTEVLLGLSSVRTFVIKGKDREELADRLKMAEETLKNAPQRTQQAQIAVNFRPSGLRPELRFYPNREASAHLAIPSAQIAETLYVLNEGVITTTMEIEGRPLDVRVMANNSLSQKASLHAAERRLEQVPLRTAQGKTVYLGSLGRIERREADAALARLDRSDVVFADISLQSSASQNSALKRPTDKNITKTVNEAAAKFSWFCRADESAFSRYKNSLLLYIILVLILLYMTMGAQFESFLLPLILMLTIPFSLAGAGPALLISGSMLDSGAILGLAALFGLVVNNSLILYEISEQKIRANFSAAAAVYCGSCERLQAILITTATTIFALLPLILSPMGNSQKSMAAAMLGGLAASTLLSLFAIPPVLIRFFKWKISKSGAVK